MKLRCPTLVTLRDPSLIARLMTRSPAGGVNARLASVGEYAIVFSKMIFIDGGFLIALLA
jgi:hypothetical protein